jgi:hypothetical protein
MRWAKLVGYPKEKFLSKKDAPLREKFRLNGPARARR